MRTSLSIVTLGLLALCLATPSFAQQDINPLGLDGDPLHLFSSPAPPPPAPEFVRHHHHMRHHYHMR